MSIYKTAINKPITTGLIFVAVIILGLFSLTRLPIDQLPEMDPPYVTVMTTYAGANASDIETNITKILENSLNSVDGLKNITLPPNGIVGVIGPNGAGKTTLFRLIMGLEQPDAGTFEVGETVKLAYVDQSHHDIKADASVYQTVSQGNELIRMGGRDINARAYLSRFNFSGVDQEKKCGVLSGGERNRLHLAMALKEEGNVLLLDEPTNDIDVNTLRALEEGLEAFAGCAVVISHDRWFLDRICTHILAFEGDGHVYFYEGSYTDYEAHKMKRLGLEEPKRIRYRKLTED